MFLTINGLKFSSHHSVFLKADTICKTNQFFYHIKY